ncbi:MAG: ABC transporter permease [Rhizobiaceae bacterium]|nr:ABC transporter permease [Rhizobiaceae bacterium]
MSEVVRTTDGAATRSARRTNWARGFYRFRQNPLSVIGLVIVALLLLLALFGEYIAPYPEHLNGEVNVANRFQPPSAEFWFGTNEVGQDIFSLVLAGARISLLSGIAVIVLATLIGTFIGVIAGYFGTWLDEILMRFTDLILTLPALILAMAIAAGLGPSIPNMILALALAWWPGFARMARGEVLSSKAELYVLAARAQGAGNTRILTRHILPNITSPIIVKMSLDVGFAILAVASLGFIGIGVRPPTPEWGVMLSISRSNLPHFWWTAIFPGLAIFLSVLSFNFMGDGLRDVFDPRARR